MPNEPLINIYYPIKKENNVATTMSDIILLSKETSEGSEYYAFNVQTFTLRKIDNLMNYLISHNIHSLKESPSSQHIIENIGLTLKRKNDSESLNSYQKLISSETKVL